MGIIQEPIRGKLLGALKERRLVPFLGAGACAAKNGTPGLPLGGAVAEALVREMNALGKPSDDIQNPKNLMEVATHFEHSLNRQLLIETLRTQLPYREIQPLPTHRSIARLGCGVIITTNYDSLMERALTDAKVEWRRIVQPRGGFKEQHIPFSLYAERRTIVYNMHGSLEEINDDLVITEDDYLSFLVEMSNRAEGIPPRISQEFATSTLLFLGFKLEDWDFRVFYKMFDQFPATMRPQSFAVVRSASEFAKAYWLKRGISLIAADGHEFASELADAFDPAGAAAGGKPPGTTGP